MKYLAIILAAVTLSGCTMSIGAGYRKTPRAMEPAKPVPLAFTPAQIETIISVIGAVEWAKIAEYALPKDEQVTLGGWVDVEIR